MNGPLPPPAWLTDLAAEVDRTWETTGAVTPGWPDPHPGMESPRDEEYSRLTDPDRFAILTNRLRTWTEVVTSSGLASVRESPPPRPPWLGLDHPGDIDSVVEVHPHRPGALGLRVAVTPPEGSHVALACAIHADAHPPSLLGIVPDCGCDACDWGSQPLLEELDGWFLTVARGGEVHRRTGDRYETRTFTGYQSGGMGSRAGEPTRRWSGPAWR